MKHVQKKQTVLVIGSGGREHAIGWKLARSPLVDTLYFAPGNGGTAAVGENVAIAVDDVAGLAHFAKSHAVDLTVVGPEAALVAGVVDRFTTEGLRIFGPTKQAARLETSKAWAVEFMKRHNLPCPLSEVFDRPDEALAYAEKLGGDCVVKADGLCQGKGVFVCSTVEEAKKAIDTLMIEKAFGQAGVCVVIQEKLVGKEVSVMAFCDGHHAIPLVAAQDYKRVYDGDKGPNTGSMGSLAPSKHASPTILKKIHRLLTLTVAAMREEGMPYHGVLYGGMMLAGKDPYILEFNCRFGDPETQVQLPLLVTDLLPILEACIDGSLTPALVRFSKKTAVCVVLASAGYPGEYTVGEHIYGLDTSQQNGAMVCFHAGTTMGTAGIKTAGGRVLGVTAAGASVDMARARAYKNIGKNIRFGGMHYRTDIGL